MPEISHVRLAATEQGALNRVLREGGAQLFPQWLYAEPGDEDRILWWGLRGAPLQMLDVPDGVDARRGLFPHAIDDWTEAPRGLVLATVDAARAIDDLAPALGSGWTDVGADDVLGARCHRLTLGRSELVLAEAATEGYAAACLARWGEGPIAVAPAVEPGEPRPRHVRPARSAHGTDARLPPGAGVIDADAHRREVETWRDGRSAALLRDLGWLTLAGFGWLRDGRNRIGRDPDADVVLPAAASGAGTISVAAERVTADGSFTIDGEPADGREVQTDRDGEPTILALGSLRLAVIERGGRIALRTWDLDAPARRTFAGVPHFPVEPAWRCVGRFTSTPDRRIRVPDVLGIEEDQPSPGTIALDVAGAVVTLEALEGGPEGELWIVFGDATNGVETYGGGRFLYTPPPMPDGTVVVDFNRAYNPPCVFSPYATCPLPWATNRLPVRIEAGERVPAGGEPHAD